MPAQPLSQLRQRLKQLSYTEERVAARLRIWHISAITLPQYPVYHERLRVAPDHLATVIALFLLQSEVKKQEVTSALSADLVRELLERGLLVEYKTGILVATISVYPCNGFYFVTDHHFRPPSVRPRREPKQPVMHFGNDTYILSYIAPRPAKNSHVLDLCTGSGVHGILAATRGARVVGVDLNPRAIKFARLNAEINGVASRCVFRHGSLYEPVSSDRNESENFDLILANPPFTPSPRTGKARVLFQDAGPAGDEIVGPLLAGLVERMKPGGTAVILSMFADQKGRSFPARIKKWIGPRVPVELLLLKIYTIDPEELVSILTWRFFGDDFADYTRRYREWLRELKASEVTKLTYAVLVVRLSETFSFRCGDLPLATALNKNYATKLLTLN